MQKQFFFLFICAILQQSSFAQTNFQISTVSGTNEIFKSLLLKNKEIAANDTLNEKILDLAEPMLVDSVVKQKRQHHKVFLVGWLIHAFGGYNWRTVNMHKQKFVGTVAHDGRSGAFEYTEYDIKYHLHFHLPQYFEKIFQSYDLQKKYHRQDIRPSHHTDYSKEPYTRNPGQFTPEKYDLGAELTPPPAFIPQLNYSFFPTLPDGEGLREHPNFGTPHPSMGFYGVSCLDCNHNCHPELHPYEWTWWLNLKNEESTAKVWLVGLFHEGSNRMKKWSANPMTGEITIPFAQQIDSINLHFDVNIEHLIFCKFEPESLKQIALPENAIDSRNEKISVRFLKGQSELAVADLHFNQVLKTDGLRYYFTAINWDEEKRIVSGYLHLAVSVKDLYTTKITFTNHDNKPN